MPKIEAGPSRTFVAPTTPLAGFAKCLLAFLCCCAVPAARAANMTPIAVTGFNRDLVIESSASGPPFSSAALEFNPNEGTAFYQSGLPGKTYGLPASGSFTSAVGDGTQFQFQPYTSMNALVLSSETGLTSGTLTLVTPTIYSRIAIIANSASGGGVPNVTLHFDNSTSFVTTYNAPDWFRNSGFALQGVDRINISSGSTDGGPNDPRFYQTTIDLAGSLGSSNRPLVSITFDKAATAQSTAIYAVSGLPAAAVGLATLTNAPATSIQAKTATLGGQVTATGGEAPAVTIYYGPADGMTNIGAWAQSIALGVQSGSFAQTVTGLSASTTYFFTAKAVNSAGTTWAGPSQTFSTLALTLPAVTNLPPSGIQATLATLNGQIIATGGDPPTVTLYYGPTDGGPSAGGWAQNISLGLQSGSFAQTVSGLSSNTTYFYTANAVNGAGAAWAASSQMFTTQATNTTAPFAGVLTQHNDNSRTGANLNESILNINNVNTNQFGLVFTRAVDDQVYAQPLVMNGVSIPGVGARNIVIVATVNDSVYAFDGDDPSVSAPYWQVSFLGPNAVAPRNSDMTGACGGRYQDFSGNIGIVGTPVIDAASGTVYLVARTLENLTTFVQRLHALDVRTGAERTNSPTVIMATYPGSGAGNTFDPQRQNQRPGLALVNGIVYISWASHCDWGPYHGWVIGYDAATMQRAVVFNDTPNGGAAGIWMSGQAPAADTNGNLYLSTGNGTVDTSGGVNRGESFLKLTRSGTNLNITSWFTPYNWLNLENGDVDLGSAGLLLIPGTTLAFSGGKQGVVYLVKRDNMGGLSGDPTADTNVVQTFSVASAQIHGGPIWWDAPDGSYSYIWPSSVHLQQYKFDRAAGMFLLPAYAQGSLAAPNGQPGGILAVSAHGTNAGTGIVWAYHQLTGDANQSVRPGILHAYNAQNVTSELWNSQQVSARDSVGNYAKFCPPTVANGKVYLATFSSRLNVYGLLPSTAPPQLSLSPSRLNFGPLVIGRTSTQSFQLVNTGGPTLNGSAATTLPFAIQSGSPFSLTPGQTGLVAVSFSPTNAATFSNLVVFTSNGGNSSNSVTGTGLTPAQLAVTPPGHDFGTVAVGASAQTSFVVTNLGGAALTNGLATVSGGPFTIVSGTPFALPGFGGTNLVVRFAPTNAANFTNKLIVTTGNGGNSTNTLTGTGALAPTANFTGSPTMGIWPLTVSFTDKSTGTITTGFWDFGDGATINTAASGVMHTYNQAGTNTVSLTVSGPVGNDTLTRPSYILVTNLPPQLSLSPPSLNFGPLVIGQTSTQSFQLVNTGGPTLNGSAATMLPFAIQSGSPFSLTPGQTGLVAVSFSPTNAASFSNLVVFTSNGGNSSNSVTGTGLTPAQLAVTPPGLDFGTVAVGASAQASFVVTNLGGAALTNGVATISPGPFTIISGTPFALPGFGATNLVVRFAPTNAANFTNKLVVTTGNGGNSTNTLTGTAALAPTANFTGSPTMGTWPLTVSFTDKSTGTITNGFWDFGDGANTNTATAGVMHTYQGAGTNTVSLTVSGPVGADTLTRPNYIVVTNLPPVIITILISSNHVQLTWQAGTLQSANKVTSPYADVSGATSPYSVPLSSATRFFRVKVR